MTRLPIRTPPPNPSHSPDTELPSPMPSAPGRGSASLAEGQLEGLGPLHNRPRSRAGEELRLRSSPSSPSALPSAPPVQLSEAVLKMLEEPDSSNVPEGWHPIDQQGEWVPSIRLEDVELPPVDQGLQVRLEPEDDIPHFGFKLPAVQNLVESFRERIQQLPGRMGSREAMQLDAAIDHLASRMDHDKAFFDKCMPILQGGGLDLADVPPREALCMLTQLDIVQIDDDLKKGKADLGEGLLRFRSAQRLEAISRLAIRVRDRMKDSARMWSRMPDVGEVAIALTDRLRQPLFLEGRFTFARGTSTLKLDDKLVEQAARELTAGEMEPAGAGGLHVRGGQLAAYALESGPVMQLLRNGPRGQAVMGYFSDEQQNMVDYLNAASEESTFRKPEERTSRVTKRSPAHPAHATNRPLFNEEVYRRMWQPPNEAQGAAGAMYARSKNDLATNLQKALASALDPAGGLMLTTDLQRIAESPRTNRLGLQLIMERAVVGLEEGHLSPAGQYGGSKSNLLHLAMMVGNLDVAKQVAAKAGLTKVQELLAQPDSKGDTALHHAAGHGKSSGLLVQDLLQLGAPVNAANSQGTTPLHLAAMNGDEGTVKAILEKGGDVKATDVTGMAALHWAAVRGNLPAVRLLLQHNADASQMNGSKKMPVDLLAVPAGRGHEFKAMRDELRNKAMEALQVQASGTQGASSSRKS